MMLPIPPTRCEVWPYTDGPGGSYFAYGVLVNPESGEPVGIIVANTDRGRFEYVPNDRYQFEWRENHSGAGATGEPARE